MFSDAEILCISWKSVRGKRFFCYGRVHVPWNRKTYWMRVTPLWTLRTTSRGTSFSILLEKWNWQMLFSCKKYLQNIYLQTCKITPWRYVSQASKISATCCSLYYCNWGPQILEGSRRNTGCKFSFIQISVNHTAGADVTTIGLSGTQTQLFENWKSWCGGTMELLGQTRSNRLAALTRI